MNGHGQVQVGDHISAFTCALNASDNFLLKIIILFPFYQLDL